MSTNPIAIAPSQSVPLSTSVPTAVHQVVQRRIHAESALHSPALEHELAEAIQGPHVAAARDALQDVISSAAEAVPDFSTASTHAAATKRIEPEHEARIEFCHAWALGRIGEYDGTEPRELPAKLDESLRRYQRAADLLQIPAPPHLDQVPSVTRPGDVKRQPGLELPEVPAWAGEMLAEWARTQTTLAFSTLLSHEGPAAIDQATLADQLEIACRRNVQALFTPIDPLSSADDSSTHEAGTVMGNARLISQISSLLPYSTSPELWSRQLGWATHVADVKFVEASMTANRLVDAASAQAAVLQDPKINPAERHEIRKMLEGTIKQLAPLERLQGNVLLRLGRSMLDAVGALYLGRTEGYMAERRRRDDEAATSQMGDEVEEEEEDEANPVEVPENELVRETRQVLIRAAALFENAYASFLKSPPSIRRPKFEKRLLRRLEATYCDLEILDNATPEVVELRSQRIERALWINERLTALGDGRSSGPDDEADESEDEDEDRDRLHGIDSDEEDEAEKLAKRFGRQRIV
ncbi:hypothetical protein JCM10212_007107 [Sporobolomyces blumeae]